MWPVIARRSPAVSLFRDKHVAAIGFTGMIRADGAESRSVQQFLYREADVARNFP